jgi:hypothetical protein
MQERIEVDGGSFWGGISHYPMLTS